MKYVSVEVDGKLLVTLLRPRFHFSFNGVRHLPSFLMQTCPKTLKVKLNTSARRSLSYGWCESVFLFW